MKSDNRLIIKRLCSLFGLEIARNNHSQSLLDSSGSNHSWWLSVLMTNCHQIFRNTLSYGSIEGLSSTQSSEITSVLRDLGSFSGSEGHYATLSKRDAH